MNQSQKKKLRAQAERKSSQRTPKGLPAPDKNNFEGDSSLIPSDQSNQQDLQKELGAIKKLAGIFEMMPCIGFPSHPTLAAKSKPTALFYNQELQRSLTSDFIDISLSSSEDPPPPLAEILFARRPYLSDILVEHGKCAGLGPSSVTEILEPIAEGPIPSHDRLALERLAFCSRGLLYQLRKPKSISPRRRRELQGQRVTDSIASRMEEDFVRGLGIATPIEPFTKEELFQFLIESLWIWVQDARCKIELR
ncbi:uncharacterized protein MELLADRAFT_112492 [Melampsora larici-populina 98AG31]|uniref:Uncharacterized protein n=1 Tax=Melampsora larici-populina (strain 98AG31 / pathotype 3-4-7) TaxID=747676 RepID=F4S6M9_MELLP|nr:uncharacterized protein MELLADRAFT_112492 [Melampsora larici-populina 98AG31]EGF99718.1 hypothetical protein MELLADRAFT_112492 [Melampsora larici-populina 98AG31]